MVPFLRIVPIGGVCLTALVLVLALEPPGKPPHVPAPDMVLARGPLIDRAAHPEWPQIMVRAAYMRAGEILKLRDLPNTPTEVAPVMLPPQRPAIPPVMPAPAAQPAAEPAPATPQTMAPVPAAPADNTAKIEAASKSDVKADAASTAPTPQAVIAATPQSTAPAADAGNTVPVPTPKPTQLAALPVERAASAPASDDEVTGSVADSSSATIPVDIGEASSTELPIVLPRERPAILRVRRRGEERRRVQPHHQAKARVKTKPKPPGNEQPASQVNLFDQLFDGKNAPNRKAAPAGARGAKTATTQVSGATNNLSPPPPYYFPSDTH